MITGAPGQEFEAVAEGFDTGLVGTLGVTIDDNAANNVMPRTTDNIVELQTVGTLGVYGYQGTLPATPGTYALTWDDGVTSGSEEITVLHEFQPSPDLAATALCTDEDVRKYLGIKWGDLTVEDRSVITRLVNAASETYTDESQRIWKLDPDIPRARLYRYDAYDVTAGRLRIDDATLVTSVSAGDYRDPLGAIPMNGGSWYAWQDEPGYPITAVVFALGSPFDIWNTVMIEADWGWPRVPEKVRQDVIYTAAEWYARDVEKFSATFSLDQGRVLLPQVLPMQVQRNAESWRRWRVA